MLMHVPYFWGDYEVFFMRFVYIYIYIYIYINEVVSGEGVCSWWAWSQMSSNWRTRAFL